MTVGGILVVELKLNLNFEYKDDEEVDDFTTPVVADVVTSAPAPAPTPAVVLMGLDWIDVVDDVGFNTFLKKRCLNDFVLVVKYVVVVLDDEDDDNISLPILVEVVVVL